MTTISYSGYRFPAEVIQHAVWIYLRFTLSYRDVEELLAERGIEASVLVPLLSEIEFARAAAGSVGACSPSSRCLCPEPGWLRFGLSRRPCRA